MYIGEVFSSNKWDIIRDLSQEKLSPIQLAERYNTTVGNVGHQLRLLEAYGLIKSERISNREKGKPRTLFSLANDCAYLVTASKGLADRKLLQLSSHHDTILKMWFLEDSRLHYFIEKFYWKIEDHMADIACVLVKPSVSGVSVIIVSEKNLTGKIGSKITVSNRESEMVDFKIDHVGIAGLRRKNTEGYHCIHDPQGLY